MAVEMILRRVPTPRTMALTCMTCLLVWPLLARAKPHPRSTRTLQFQAVYQRPQLAPPKRKGGEAGRRRSRQERARTHAFRLRMRRIPPMLLYPRLFLRLKLLHASRTLRPHAEAKDDPWLNLSSTDTAYMRVMGV